MYMSNELKVVLMAALTIANDRCGDVSTDDGDFATCPAEAMIALESALISAFPTGCDDVIAQKILPKIESLSDKPTPKITLRKKLPTEEGEYFHSRYRNGYVRIVVVTKYYVDRDEFIVIRHGINCRRNDKEGRCQSAQNISPLSISLSSQVIETNTH